MLYFPQLSSGAVCQYPLERQLATRTIINLIESGESILMPDIPAQRQLWRLTFSALTDAEWAAIESLFESTRGMCGTFCFLDPTSNLMGWSGDVTNAVWRCDPLLNVSEGLADAEGSNNATRITNTSQAIQGLSQLISGPGWYRYSFSYYLRSDAATFVTSRVSTTTQQVCQIFEALGQWTRFVQSVSLPTEDEGVTFSLEFQPGAQADVYGLQVEAQPGAGQYKRTLGRGGVFTNCRFNNDVLTVSTNGPNQHSGTIELISNIST